MKEQLDQHQFEDEELFEMHRDLILTYIINRAKTTKEIPLTDIAKELELPLGAVKDLTLLLIADELIDGLIISDVLNLD